MVIACVVSVVVLVSGIVVYSALLASKKADETYEKVKREMLEEMKKP